jgi:hypothetical protein
MVASAGMYLEKLNPTDPQLTKRDPFAGDVAGCQAKVSSFLIDISVPCLVTFIPYPLAHIDHHECFDRAIIRSMSSLNVCSASKSFLLKNGPNVMLTHQFASTLRTLVRYALSLRLLFANASLTPWFVV